MEKSQEKAADIQRVLEIYAADDLNTLLECSEAPQAAAVAPGGTNVGIIALAGSLPPGSYIARLLAVDGGGCAGPGNLYDTLDLAFSVADVFVDSIGFQGQPNFDQGDNVTFDVDFSSGSPASGILNVGNTDPAGFTSNLGDVPYTFAASGSLTEAYAFQLTNTAFIGTYMVTATLSSGGNILNRLTANFSVLSNIGVKKFSLTASPSLIDISQLQIDNSGAGKSVDITLELYDAGSGDFISDIRIANEFIRANPATNFDNMYDFAVAAGSYRVDVRITDVGSENLLASDSATITVP